MLRGGVHHGDRDSGDIIEDEMFEVWEHATKLEDEESDEVKLEYTHVRQHPPRPIPLESRP